MQKSFLFDINKCTGCQACTIACSTENYEKQECNWRDVHIYNEAHIPELPYFNLSLACNHCIEPVCLSACPAKAYSKDDETGAVLINQNNCIGCKYCTWACPYDAPKFNQKSKVIEKCTFCNDRLKSGKDPACVIACPTGSLQITDWQIDSEPQDIPGFTNSDLKPKIRFIPLKEEYKFPEMIESQVADNLPDLFELKSFQPLQKISLGLEWPLVIFTSIMFVMVSWFTANTVKNILIEPWLFLGIGVCALLSSSIHLGNKFRAYRAIINFKTSWLSREIVLVSGFLFFAGYYFFSTQIAEFISWLAIISGFAGLYSIDILYRVTMTKIPLHLHSASTFLTSIFLFGFFTMTPAIITIFGTIKLIFYLYRKIIFYKNGYSIMPLVSFLRITLGFIVPAIGYFITNDISESLNVIIISVISGEIIDRCEFYDELDIITPKRQIQNDIQESLKTIYSK